VPLIRKNLDYGKMAFMGNFLYFVLTAGIRNTTDCSGEEAKGSQKFLLFPPLLRKILPYTIKFKCVPKSY